MNTLLLFSEGNHTVPGSTSWYLADLGEFRGKQELFTRQAPQRLKTMLEHALIESSISSNRLEGVEVDPRRIRNVLASPKPQFRDRDEEEVRGYRGALCLIHQNTEDLLLSEEAIRRLHHLTRGQIWDAGCYKSKDGDIIERYPDGRERVRFRTVPALETPNFMADLIANWARLICKFYIETIRNNVVINSYRHLRHTRYPGRQGKWNRVNFVNLYAPASYGVSSIIGPAEATRQMRDEWDRI